MHARLRHIAERKLLAGTLVAAAGVVAYAVAGATLPQRAADAPQYVTAPVARGTLVVSVAGSGQIAAANQINVQPQVSGTVAAVPAENSQNVRAGDLLVELDTTNDERAVRNAKANLQSADLALQTLEQPATTSSILQAQEAAVNAAQSLQTAQNNLATDYSTAFTDISNTFIDLPGVMTGLNNVIYSNTISKTQSDADAYTNLVAPYFQNAAQYNQAAVTSYQAALAAYNQNLTDYKNASVYSSTSTVETLLAETYTTLKAVSAANSDVKNLLDLVQNVLQQNSVKLPAQLTADETSLQSYLTTTNSHLASLLQATNALQTDKQTIAAGNISVSQTQAALAQLEAGPTALAVQTQELAVTQAQNALTDAEQNLAYDYVRAPFDGVVTNVTAKVTQPVGSGTVLAVLVAKNQLAQATLNETDVVNVKVGQKATVTFDALPNLTLTGTVSEVDTLGTIVQGVVSYNVQVALDVPNPHVKPGMSDTVSIITSVKQDALLVPNSAITSRQGATFVQLMGANGTPELTPVTTGLANDTMTEILSGLRENDKIVVQTKTTSAQAAAPRPSGFFLGGGRALGR